MPGFFATSGKSRPPSERRSIGSVFVHWKVKLNSTGADVCVEIGITSPPKVRIGMIRSSCRDHDTPTARPELVPSSGSPEGPFQVEGLGHRRLLEPRQDPIVRRKLERLAEDGLRD